MIDDFASGFDKRLEMMTLNSILLNSPAALLNGMWLKKLVDSKDSKEFDRMSKQIQSVFNMKTSTPLHRVKGIFLDYLKTFRNRHSNFERVIEHLLIEYRTSLDNEVSEKRYFGFIKV